jgi:drug/metabolite transporter (DMT)-like permease
MATRAKLLSTTEGATNAAFGVTEWTLLAAISLIWGASFLFIANGVEAFAPATVGWMRLGFGMTTLSLIPAARVPIERSDRSRVLLLAVVWMAVPLTLFPFAEQRISSAVAGMLNGAMPLLVAAVAAVMLRRRPGRNQLVGLAVGFAGVVLISVPSLDSGSSSAIGVAMVLVAILGYAAAANLNVPLTQRYGSLGVQRVVQTTAFALTTPMGVWGLRSSHFAWGPFLSVLTLGVVGTGLAFVLAGRLFARVGATRGSVFTYLMPPVALALGVVFRSEHVALLAVSGVPFVVLGALLTSRAGR